MHNRVTDIAVMVPDCHPHMHSHRALVAPAYCLFGFDTQSCCGPTSNGTYLDFTDSSRTLTIAKKTAARSAVCDSAPYRGWCLVAITQTPWL